jgi:hypothetical protein
MAFDQVTRNRLSKFVTDTRKLLSDEFAQQMRVKYGLDPATGIVTDIDKLPTMAEGDRQTTQMLRDTLDHYLASSPKREKKAIATTIDRIVREQAFTVLNRLCAVRMAEARDLVIESIGRGTKSKGFQLYSRLVGSALGETGEAYVSFLFSLFDELSIDLPVLFDRFSTSGRLFPKESVLLEVLEQINHHELQHLWAEDETIGWVYQFFNSQDERRAMRDESSAPRNSRELAVRNQFFTPRYVVEFLTDNTLGRIWYEMTQGQTRLVDDCKYLVRQPDEVFLSHMTSKDREHTSDGTIAMAELLLSGTVETFPEFSACNQQPMIDLAHCVSAYTTMGDRAHEILANRTLLVRERSVQEPREVGDAVEAASYVFARQLGMLKTQHILEVLFMTCRNDRHGGDGSVYSEPWFVEACNEVRRRVLNSRRDDLSQEELLQQPVFIPYRPAKDPRDIKMLDPACGSMHFGLYAFDLFLHIYDEAWELEEQLGDRAFLRPRELKSLHDSYGTRENYLLDAPRLIIERNIHGIDIDARAVQIAGLSLWLRAQKAWHEAGVKPVASPQITRSNIVCAEPMPGESDLLEQFITDHLSQTSEQQAIASIVRRVFDAMNLAGEAGSLLKIEEEIADTIAEAKKKWIEGPTALQLPLFEIDSVRKDKAARPLLVAGIDDSTFWDDIEERIYLALRKYADAAVAATGLRLRLFTGEVSKGFAFLDLIRKKYDVVLMNPPFGDCTEEAKPLIFASYGRERIELGGCFVTRFSQRLAGNGKLGVIANRTLIISATLSIWRKEVLGGAETVVDLGHGVLDALVETSAITLSAEPSQQTFFVGALDAADKATYLHHSVSSLEKGICLGSSLRSISDFDGLYGAPFAYWAPRTLIDKVNQLQPAELIGGIARQGLATCDNFRFLRLFFEISRESTYWSPLTKGGEYQPFWADVPLRVNWKNDGAEVKAAIEVVHGQWSRVIQSTNLYGIPGATYSERTASSLSLRILPKNSIFDKVGPFVGAESVELSRRVAIVLIGLSYTSTYRFLIETAVGLRDGTTSGSAARHYLPSIIQRLPWPELDQDSLVSVMEVTERAIGYSRDLVSLEETSNYWHEPIDWARCATLRDYAAQHQQRWCDLLAGIYECASILEKTGNEIFGIEEADLHSLYSVSGPSVVQYPKRPKSNLLNVASLVEDSAEKLIQLLVNNGKSHSTIYKKAYWGDRNIELLAHYFESHPATIVEELKHAPPSSQRLVEAAWRVLSIAIAAAFGRIKIEQFITPTSHALPEDLFDYQVVNRPMHNLRIILCDDPGHKYDIVKCIDEILSPYFGGDAIDQIASLISGEGFDLRHLISSKFFEKHLSVYSDFRRQAPVYWPLSSRGGALTLWVFYHHLNDQTLFTAVNEFVDPKLKDLQQHLDSLRGRDSRSKEDERKFEALTIQLEEINEFRSELLRVGKFWKPNLNDGVQITAAPFWFFFQSRKWRDTLKKTWEELEEGKYDWAHLALSIWPERVVRTAHKDRSIAIAHSLEDALWHELEIKKSSKTGRVTVKYEWQPRELSEKELNAIVQRVKNGESVVSSGENAKS